jgi:mannosyltransferase
MALPQMSTTAVAGREPVASRAGGLLPWWPLAALTLLAAALRFSTLGLQSFWYDEAFIPVHVLHPGLAATWRSFVHSENTPPLWYLVAWADARIFGTGEIALRWPSALAGTATVPVVWAIARELSQRRAVAVAAAALVAVNPLFVWYSQEARAYALFVLLAALMTLCFLRADRRPTRGRMAAFALTGSLAMLSHYFALFLLIPMVLWLAREQTRRRAAVPAVAAFAIVGLALIPLISAQGGHGTQWIGRWALSSRLQAIPQYYLTDYYGAALGHSVELLAALPIVAGVGFGLWRVLRPSEERAVLLMLLIAAGGILIPIVLVAFGADYLAPRNLVAAMIPVTVAIALIVVSERAGRVGIAFAALIALAFLAVSIDVNLSPRLQRGNWRGLAKALRTSQPDRAITTVELGSAPLEYYLPGLHNLARGASVSVREIDETGYAPLRASAGQPPVPGFRPAGRLEIDGLIAYRFLSPVARSVPEAALRRAVITLAHPEVLVPTHAGVSRLGAQTFPQRALRERARPSSADEKA